MRDAKELSSVIIQLEAEVALQEVNSDEWCENRSNLAKAQYELFCALEFSRPFLAIQLLFHSARSGYLPAKKRLSKNSLTQTLCQAEKLSLENIRVEKSFFLGLQALSGVGTTPNDYLAFQYIVFSAAKTYASAQYILGWMYSNGRGVEENDAQAVYWYRKAAEQEFAGAQNNLGTMFLNGNGVDKNNDQAVYWFRKAAEQGLAEAQYYLGSMYSKGVGLSKDDVQAFFWYRKAAIQGFICTQYNLGCMFTDGRGVDKDNDQAVYWYRKAAEQGLAEVQRYLGCMFLNGGGVDRDEVQAVYWISKAAEQGLAQAQNNLGTMFLNGNGVDKNNDQAVYWFRKAAEQEFAGAQNNLGTMFLNGNGVEQDDVQAVYWIRKAAEQNLDAAQSNLGVIFADGIGVDKDDVQAVYWYRKAAEQGLAQAQNNLGNMFLNGNGLGISKDNVQAVYWYRKAAEQGLSNAQNNLGYMFLEGTGVPQDNAHATYWIRKAAVQGNNGALKTLETIERGGVFGARYHLAMMKDDQQRVTKLLNEEPREFLKILKADYFLDHETRLFWLKKLIEKDASLWRRLFFSDTDYRIELAEYRYACLSQLAKGCNTEEISSVDEAVKEINSLIEFLKTVQENHSQYVEMQLILAHLNYIKKEPIWEKYFDKAEAADKKCMWIDRKSIPEQIEKNNVFLQGLIGSCLDGPKKRRECFHWLQAYDPGFFKTKEKLIQLAKAEVISEELREEVLGDIRNFNLN